MDCLEIIREIETSWIILRIPEVNKNRKIVNQFLKKSGLDQENIDITFHKDRVILDFSRPINAMRIIRAIEDIKGGE